MKRREIVILATYYDRFVIIRQAFLINLMKKLSKKVEPGKTEMKIYYNEGEQIKDPRLLKTSKISFHASGRIHYAGEQLLSKPLRILKEQHELCIVLFCHPAKYGIDKVKPHDIVLDYTGDESKPIIAQIFVAPHEKAKLVSHPTAENQIHLVFEANCLHNIPDLIIQILLIEPVAGPWPQNRYIFYLDTRLSAKITHDETFTIGGLRF